MARLGGWRVRLADTLSVLAQLHAAALVGAAAALVSDFLGTDATAKILVGLGVTLLVREVGDLAGSGKRAECMRTIATNARSALEQRLELGFIDRFRTGNFVTL